MFDVGAATVSTHQPNGGSAVGNIDRSMLLIALAINLSKLSIVTDVDSEADRLVTGCHW